MFPPPAGRRWRESCSSQIGESSSEMMSLLIRNLQSVVHVRRAPLRKNLEIARSCLRVRHFDVGVICVNNAKIRQLNKSYRKKDTATDVLSFPFHEVTAVHGLCHLLGYTHDRQEDWKQMFAKENEVLCEINKATGSALKPLTTNHFDH
ncbi:endoribonuclease YbeY isoform X4 [Rana temporaria]|uniref:endoribonuclease YbeY isoform X4 n=1 Tax=Rana temporaria TaxID=8407 RepID=UPI001AAD3515|nr:endoribonuclease YbeY isoform X4 [Rana temporaria]